MSVELVFGDKVLQEKKIVEYNMLKVGEQVLETCVSGSTHNSTSTLTMRMGRNGLRAS